MHAALVRIEGEEGVRHWHQRRGEEMFTEGQEIKANFSDRLFGTFRITNVMRLQGSYEVVGQFIKQIFMRPTILDVIQV